MRRRIFWLTAATTSAVVLAFVVPLCVLVRVTARDRALADAGQEARNIAIVVSGLHGDPQVARLVGTVDRRSDASSEVVTPAGVVMGRPGSRAPRSADLRRARTGEAFTVIDSAGARILVPIVTTDGTYVVRTAVPRAVLDQGVARAWASLAALGLLMLGVALWVADRLGRRVSTPVTDLAAVAHRLREGDLGARARPTGPPETVELGIALNRLADRIRELLEAERAAVGDLSHRLRTPVTALRLDSEAVRDPELASRLELHVAQLQRTIDAVVKDARRPVRETMGASCDAAVVVRDRVAYWSALAEDQRRELTVRVEPGALPVALGPGDLGDLVDVLVDNVFAHTPEGTPFTIAAGSLGTRTCIAVTDRGPGIDPAAEPVPDRVGSTGLGLRIVRRTVGAVGGDLEVAGSPDGTTVRLLLPRTAGQSS